MTAPIKISDMLEKSFHQATHTRSLREELGNGFAALNPTRQKELVRSLWSVSGIRPDLRNEIANLGDQDAGLRKAWIAYVKKQKGLDDNH